MPPTLSRPFASHLAWFFASAALAAAGCGAGTPSSADAGPQGSGGRLGSGGMTAGGGSASTGGSAGTGGRTGSGGSLGSGGTVAPGTGGVGPGQTGSGGAPGTGGGGGTGGRPGSGGSGAASGGAPGKGGQGGGPSGGAGGDGGARGGTGGAAGTSGQAGSGGAAGGASGGGPCDIYAAAGTPCVAAHSTTRALFGAYAGTLYQVRRASDKTTKDIPVIASGGYADASVQDAFCSGTTCTISEIFDQTANGNHLVKAPPGGWLNNGGLEANATAAKIKLNGHTVYGVYTTSNFDNDVGAVGYRNDKTKGVATGDMPEAMYMVADGKHYNQYCCFDYGNAETTDHDDGSATMEAVYFGNSTQWGRGSGSGPWVMADLENGVFAGGSTAAPATNTSLSAAFVTVVLKGPSGNHFGLKGGDAQTGKLESKYDGARPAGYSPQKKEGAIILGIGGDNSHTGEGTFFEGCITSGAPPDAVDDAIQANIVAAGYGK